VRRMELSLDIIVLGLVHKLLKNKEQLFKSLILHQTLDIEHLKSGDIFLAEHSRTLVMVN